MLTMIRLLAGLVAFLLLAYVSPFLPAIDLRSVAGWASLAWLILIVLVGIAQWREALRLRRYQEIQQDDSTKLAEIPRTVQMRAP
ncbi:MAG: hypothetical protein IMW91_01655 [Firmicutes bacterium]|nr:hypothetical protein [Bacillota bacterium]